MGVTEGVFGTSCGVLCGSLSPANGVVLEISGTDFALWPESVSVVAAIPQKARGVSPFAE